MKISVKRISEVTGFSPATVSNALNNKRGVNRETAEIILRAARENGYTPQSKIAKIRFVMYSMGGQVVSDTAFFSSLMQGIESECRINGYELVITHLNKQSAEFEDLLRQILSDAASAILLLATEMTADIAARFEQAVSPVLILDSWYPGVHLNSVLIDNADSVTAAVDWLIGRGHTSIGYLCSSVRIENFKFRETGFCLALAKHALEIDRALWFSVTPTMDGAYEDMKAHLQASPTLPTALFADNDIIALGCVKALSEQNYSVPGDVSVIGFDDMPFCTISSPPLSTVRVPKEDMGRAAVRRLLDILRYGDAFVTKTQICTRLVERASVRCLEAQTPSS